MIRYIRILENNHVYKYYFNNELNNLNNMSFYKRNMKQTSRRNSTISGLYNKSCVSYALSKYIDFSSNTFKFTRYGFYKLRNYNNRR